jgi:hypothetical protein
MSAVSEPWAMLSNAIDRSHGLQQKAVREYGQATQDESLLL